MAIVTTPALRVFQGTTFSFNGTAKGPDGSPVDLTGKVLAFHLRRPKLTAPFLRVTTSTPSAKGSTVTLTDAASGKYTVTLTPSETSDLPAGSSRFYLTLEYGDTVRPFGRGEVRVEGA